jgi:hypothetical protein
MLFKATGLLVCLIFVCFAVIDPEPRRALGLISTKEKSGDGFKNSDQTISKKPASIARSGEI